MSKDGVGLAEGQNGPHSVTYNHTQPPPITTPPERPCRKQMVNHLKQTSEVPTNDVNTVIPVANSAKICGQSNANTQSAKHTSHSDQNLKLISSGSVVINVDIGNQPSASHSVDSHDVISSARLFPEQCQLDISAASSSNNNLGNNSDERIMAGPNNNDFISNNNELLVAENNRRTTDGSFINIDRILTVAENNDGTQAPNPNRRSPADDCSFDKVFNKYTPFITFLLLKTAYDHREGIFIFAGLFIAFIHANSVIKREVAKQSRRSPLSLGIIFVNLFVSISLIYFVFQDQQLYKNLIFIPPNSQPKTLWDVLWIVGVTDFILKFITMLIKVGLMCFPAKLLPYCARGKWFLLLERVSQLYRSLVPIPPWLYYWMEVYQGAESTQGIAFCATYIFLKGSDVISNIKLFLKAFWKLLHHTNIGTRPSEEQMVTAGSQCPICHDEYNAPIMLQCSHVFCESCVSVWFDREQTCPLCRAKMTRHGEMEPLHFSRNCFNKRSLLQQFDCSAGDVKMREEETKRAPQPSEC